MAALAIGPFLYRSMLPAAAGAPPASCGFVAVTGGLFMLLASTAIWLVRRRSRSGGRGSDHRLRQAVLDEDGETRRSDGG